MNGRAGMIPVLLVSLALVAGCATPAPSPAASGPAAGTPGPSSAAASVGPGASPGITPLPTASPGAPTTGWTRLGGIARAAVASLSATRAGQTSVAVTTAFRLRSLTDAPVRELVARLVVTPRLKLAVARVTGDTAVLRPSAPLRQAQVYRFELLRGDGSTEAAWAVQAAWPLEVTTTLPGADSSGVPRDTGIELGFNQPGVRLADVRDHVTISPATAGRWERHDQTFAFVPDRPLARSTLYTVTVRRGIPLRETGMALAETRTIRFETTGERVSSTHVTLSRPMFDAAPGERPVLVLNLDSSDESEDRVATVDVRVHRLPGLTAAMAAWRQVDAAPDWTVRTSTTPVRTARLPEAFEGSVRVHHPEDDWRGWIRLPSALPAGWYVATVSHAGVARQAVLQVTRLSAYASVSGNRSLVWVNDLRSNDPVAGASVAIGGKGLGRTGADGLLVARTPRSATGDAEDERTTMVVVRAGSRHVFLPLGIGSRCTDCQRSRTDRWWQLLSLDRSRYRVTDTVNAWGVVRDRDTGSVPTAVTVLLEAAGAEVGEAAIVTRRVEPDRSGAWTASLPFDDLPPSEYRVRVRVGDADVSETWLQVGPIAKPAWRISLDTPERAVVSGALVPVTATASFFEGTSVAGAGLKFTPETWWEEDAEGAGEHSVVATTDVDGRAAASVRIRLDPDDEEGDDGQWSIGSVIVRASEPEEGDVTASAPIAVFRSTAILDLESVIAGTTMTVTGKVTAVDFGRLNRDTTTSPWEIDPRGTPLAGQSVRITIVERTHVTKQTGTRYDFVAKRVVPVYTTTTHTAALPARTAVTTADGTFGIKVTVRGGDRSYVATATHRDDGGRIIRAEAGAELAGWRDEWESGPSLVRPGTEEGWGEYEVGDTVRARFTEGRDDAELSRYLFTVDARGLRDATVQRSATFRTTFTRALVPNAAITGIRFTGDGYEAARFGANLRLDRRGLDIRLSTDRPSYRPGERVTATVETRSAAGTPVAASVFVRAVDEKLFAMGAASADDPLPELYQETWDGRLGATWSHRNPMDEGGDGKGDTTGGGGDGRTDFRDWLVAELVHTGADGRATLAFDLSDDLTSWRLVGSGVTPDLRAGVGEHRIPVSLPFFAEVVVAPEYLAADRPAIRIRAYGAALREGDPVRFTVSSGTVPLAQVIRDGVAFDAIEVALPQMPPGTHRLRVTATTPGRTPALTDTLTRVFDVVATRTVRSHVTSVALDAGTTVGGADGLTHVTLVDAGRGRVVPMLLETARAEPYRADLAIAAAMARDLLADGYGIPDDPGLAEPDLLAFQDWGGISVVPWASSDLELSAMAALSGDPRVNRDALRSYFAEVPDEENGAMPLTRRLYLLLGRAAVGDATLGEIVLAASQDGLNVKQQVTVALAALAVGDLATAERLYRAILAEHGERLGPWVRVRAANADNTAVATARLAIVAAALGDPLAIDMDAEVVAHPPRDTVVDLERVIAASWWATTQPRVEATAALTIGGVRTERVITADRPVSFDVTPAQRAGLRLDPVSGSVLVTARWDGPLADGDLVTPGGVSVTRSVSPAGAIAPTDTVVVTYRVTLPADVADGCWQLTDHVPSGLTPVDGIGRDEEAEEDSALPYEGDGPWRVVGQRVNFCVDHDPRHPNRTLRYLARVVTSGTYAWEPAVLQSAMVPEHGATVPATEIVIEGIGG